MSPDGMAPEILEALRSDLTIDITTTGRKSGKPRRIEIWFMHVDGRYFIAGTPGPRDWYANLLVEPRFTFHLKESVIADLAATAKPVVDHDARRAVLNATVAVWYRDQVDIEALVQKAPLVEVLFDD